MWMLAGVVVGVMAVSPGVFHTREAATQQAPGRQLICHVTDESGAHIIGVSTRAVPAHLRNHGDCLINSTNRDLIGESCNPTDANNNDICDVQP